MGFSSDRHPAAARTTLRFLPEEVSSPAVKRTPPTNVSVPVRAPQQARIAILRALKSAGVFEAVRDSRWRQRRLLILCYHGVALDEEHRWQSALFMEASQLQERLEILKRDNYNVLPLGEALQRLYRHDLPSRSVVLTFDDGTHDFYEKAYPLLRRYGLPATVYQTTFYSERGIPVFPLICSYILWKKRDCLLRADAKIGLAQDADLSVSEGHQTVLKALVHVAQQERLSTRQKNELAAHLSESLHFDYETLTSQRVLQLMSLEEIRELSHLGVDFQLHTHRHCAPRDQVLFEREIDDNRNVLASATGVPPVHFCYPSGDYETRFLPWLKAKGIISATTCDPGLASVRDHALLLPRFIDTSSRTALEFESWLTGVGALLSVKASVSRIRKRLGIDKV